MAGMVFALSQYLQFVLGYTPLQAAVRLLPVAISSAAASLLGARLVRPLGRRTIVSAGLAVAALALLLMSHLDEVGGYGIVAAAQVVLGFGIGLAMAPATDSVLDAVPRARPAWVRPSTTRRARWAALWAWPSSARCCRRRMRPR